MQYQAPRGATSVLLPIVWGFPQEGRVCEWHSCSFSCITSITTHVNTWTRTVTRWMPTTTIWPDSQDSIHETKSGCTARPRPEVSHVSPVIMGKPKQGHYVGQRYGLLIQRYYKKVMVVHLDGLMPYLAATVPSSLKEGSLSQDLYSCLWLCQHSLTPSCSSYKQLDSSVRECSGPFCPPTL